jgi:hypothetical protein
VNPIRRGICVALIVASAALGVPASALAVSDNLAAGDPDLFFALPDAVNTTAFTFVNEPTPGCQRVGATAWWRIAGNGHPITITTALRGTTFNTVVAVYTGTPPNLTQVPGGCSDAAPGDNLDRATLQFNSQRGTTYFVQVGGFDSCAPPLTPCPESGGLVVQASDPDRPSNDDRAAAKPVQAGAPSPSNNTGASFEPGEVKACGTAAYAATVWYRWTAPATGDAVFQSNAAFNNVSNAADTVLAVYPAGSATPLACNNDAAGPVGPSSLSLRVTAGDYFLQVGARGIEGLQTIGQGNVFAQVTFFEDLDLDRDGVPRPADCNDNVAAIHPGAVDILDDGIDQDCSGADAINLDRDGDGFSRPTDCRDDVAAIHPGALDVPGNKVDEDCDSQDAAFPTLASGITATVERVGRGIRFTSMAVTNVPAGARVRLTCRGTGCKFKTVTRVARRAVRRLDLLKPMRNGVLRRKAVVVLQVTKPGYVGKTARWTVSRRVRAVRTDRCLTAEGSKTVRC